MMKRTVPILALLAIAALGSAQDRHDRDSHDRSSHSGKPSRSRADHDRRSTGGSDRDASGRDRSGSDRTGGDRSGNDRSGGDRSGGDRPGGDGRYNPFDRSAGRRGGDRGDGPIGNPRGRAVLGVPIHDQRPLAYDGRGSAGPERFGHAPIHNALSIQIASGRGYGGTEVAVGAKIGGLRVGFVSYSNPGPRRAYAFDYPYYAYDPYAPGAVVVASPWYGYSYLPPYLDRSRVVIVDNYPAWNWDRWQRVDVDGDRSDPAVRDAIDDLRDAFEEASSRIADRLVPEEGDVAIFNDGHYDYSLNPDDFQKMFLDGVEQSKTVRYTIEEARTRGDEVRIRARHEYTDSWGETQSVIHTLTLRRENGGDYVIREFGSE